jgi:two-component system CheB/CheR fusion protein
MAQSRPLRVLLVEDYVDAATSTAEIVRLDGHDVRLAPDGPTALEAASAMEPDVVLLDLGLPGMDGYEVARRLAASCRRKPYLIAVSGFGGDDARQRSAEAGIDLYLLKPADPEQLLRILRNLSSASTG